MFVNSGLDPNSDLGPLISVESKKRVESLIEAGIKHGAKCLLDGRGVKVPGYEKGNFVGPTMLHGVTKTNPAYSEEIFGPVLVSLEVDTLEDAIEFTNSSRYGTIRKASHGALLYIYEISVNLNTHP
jgi:malonate-semialdehyde dehydrogenase (acetylating)/methylmalonate-semialdehyde dehydrogenase